MTNTVRPEENMTIGNHIQSVVIKFVNHYNLIKFKVESFLFFHINIFREQMHSYSFRLLIKCVLTHTLMLHVTNNKKKLSKMKAF